MATVSKPQKAARRPRLVLNHVGWKMYTRLLRVFAEKRGMRLTYDRGRLEIMSPLAVHDSSAEFLGQMVVVMTEELRMPRKSGGSTTLRRRQLLRGLEPDKCYWFANEAAVRAAERLDLAVDPPPDLAMEIDVTSSSLDRMGIYAAFGVPEVWRLEGGVLTFHVLAGGAYTPRSPSPTFPMITPADLMAFLPLVGTQGETSVSLQFRTWFRQRIAAPPAP